MESDKSMRPSRFLTVQGSDQHHEDDKHRGRQRKVNAEFVVRKTMCNVHEEMSDNNGGHECGSSVQQFDPVPYAQNSPVPSLLLLNMSRRSGRKSDVLLQVPTSAITPSSTYNRNVQRFEATNSISTRAFLGTNANASYVGNV